MRHTLNPQPQDRGAVRATAERNVTKLTTTAMYDYTTTSQNVAVWAMTANQVWFCLVMVWLWLQVHQN